MSAAIAESAWVNRAQYEGAWEAYQVYKATGQTVQVGSEIYRVFEKKNRKKIFEKFLKNLKFSQTQSKAQVDPEPTDSATWAWHFRLDRFIRKKINVWLIFSNKKSLISIWIVLPSSKQRMLIWRNNSRTFSLGKNFKKKFFDFFFVFLKKNIEKKIEKNFFFNFKNFRLSKIEGQLAAGGDAAPAAAKVEEEDDDDVDLFGSDDEEEDAEAEKIKVISNLIFFCIFTFLLGIMVDFWKKLLQHRLSIWAVKDKISLFH